jgi:hypothetical protein
MPQVTEVWYWDHWAKVVLNRQKLSSGTVIECEAVFDCQCTRSPQAFSQVLFS